MKRERKFVILCLVVLLGLLLIFASSGNIQKNKPSENDSPVLIVDQSILNFGVNPLGETTGTQEILIHNCGGGTLNWTVSISEEATWLECSPTSGLNFGVVEVSLGDLSGLTIGYNRAEITISDPNADHSPVTVYVTVILYKNTGHNKPFGFFDTPENNTVVNGCVPITGWALDGLEVERVKIYRDDDEDLIYIGDAWFVEGARPDVAQLCPDFPFSTRAGWGYMLLSNMLDDGLYKFFAYAVDKEGNEVKLGKKTIIINNASAQEPFGTIDFPAAGENISGVYRIWGWALTPPPACIPCDGIDVYVDGLNVETATYCIYRGDIPLLFPDYCNKDGACFYYDLNTDGYRNGSHTIHCIVTDNVDISAGIGSRYFGIRNTGTLCRVSETSNYNPDRFSMLEINEMPIYYSEPVFVKTGYDRDSIPMTLYPDKNGIVNVKIKELERIVLHLNGPYDGYLKAGKQLWPLPVGSTMDREKGIFYWSPGPGFVGDYQFVFVETESGGGMNKKLVNLTIVSKFQNPEIPMRRHSPSSGEHTRLNEAN